jgi:hypothetical protein
MKTIDDENIDNSVNILMNKQQQQQQQQKRRNVTTKRFKDIKIIYSTLNRSTEYTYFLRLKSLFLLLLLLATKLPPTRY